MLTDQSQPANLNNQEMTSLFSRLSALFYPEFASCYEAQLHARRPSASGFDIPPYLPRTCQDLQAMCGQGLSLLSSLPIVYRYFETNPARDPSDFRLEDCVDRFKYFLRLPLSNSWDEFFSYWSFGYLREISSRAYALLERYDFNRIETEYALQRLADGKLFALSPGTNFIGSAPADSALSCGIRIPDNPFVSRRHADIEVGSEGISIIDRDSSNGTFLNGSLLKRETPAAVKPGDVIAFSNEKCVLVQILKPLPLPESSANGSGPSAPSSDCRSESDSQQSEAAPSKKKLRVRIKKKEGSSGKKKPAPGSLPADFSLNFQSVLTDGEPFGFEILYVRKRHAVIRKGCGSNKTKAKEILPLPPSCETKEQIRAYVEEMKPDWLL